MLTNSSGCRDGRHHAFSRLLRALPAVSALVAINATTAQPDHSSTSACTDGSSPAWVLLTGMIGGESGMQRLETRLRAKGYCVVTIDPYAQSADSTDVSFAALARRVDATMRRQNIRSANIVGHAHGGGVALRLAASYPARVSSLNLIDVGALPTSRTALMGRSLTLIPIIAHAPGGKSFIRSKIVDGIRENSGSVAWIDARTEKAYADPILSNVGRSTAMMQRLAVAKEPELVSSLVSRLQMPVTVVLGGAPHATSPTAAHLSALNTVRGCLRIVPVRGAGHFVQEEAPDQVVSIIDSPCVTLVAGARQ